jgi:hypothetical protein
MRGDGGGGIGRVVRGASPGFASALTAPTSYIFSAWMYACGGERRGGGRQTSRARARGETDRGNPKTKKCPSAVNIQRAGAARRRTGSSPPPPPRLGAEVLKVRTDAVRARCATARRTPLTRALDMMECHAPAQVGASRYSRADDSPPAWCDSAKWATYRYQRRYQNMLVT